MIIWISPHMWKSLLDFVSPSLKLYNRYCYNPGNLMLVWFWMLPKMWKWSIITSKLSRMKILPTFPFPGQFWIPEVEITNSAKLRLLRELGLVYWVLLLKTLFQLLPGRSVKMPKNLLEFLEKKLIINLESELLFRPRCLYVFPSFRLSKKKLSMVFDTKSVELF